MPDSILIKKTWTRSSVNKNPFEPTVKMTKNPYQIARFRTYFLVGRLFAPQREQMNHSHWASVRSTLIPSCFLS